MSASSFTSFDHIDGEQAELISPSRIPATLAQRFKEDFLSNPWPARWLDDLKSFGDGGQWQPIGGASGTRNDRLGGRDLPLFWSELDLRGFRVHSRYLWDLNPFMIGFGGALVGYHVRKGYGWQACLKGKRKTPYPTELVPSDPLVAKAQHILDSWRDANKWPLKSREAFRRWRRDGELFGRLGYGGMGNLPWFRFVEPEQVGSPTGETIGPESFGIEKTPHDQAGPSLAFHVWDMEDGDGDWVDGSRMIHAKANVDDNVKRGIPDTLPVNDDLDGVRRLLRNMTITAQDQAAVAWLEKFPTATGEQVRTLMPSQGASANVPTGTNIPWWMSDGRGGTVNRFRGGAVIRTEGSRQFEASPYSQGVPNYIEVLQASLRAMCVRWNLPEYMTGKANDVNFAAALTTGSPFAVAVEGGQLEFGLCWEKPVALKVLELARDAGMLSYEEWKQLDVEVEEPALVTPEPDKDALRITSLVAAKLLSTQTAQLQLQLDPQHESENMAAVAKQQQEQMVQQQAAMGGGGGGQQPGDGGDSPPDPSGGGSFGRAGLMKKAVMDKNGGQRTVWVSKAQEFLDRSHLIQSTIIDKNGVERHVWVHPDEERIERPSAAVTPVAAPVPGAPVPVVGPDHSVPHALVSLAREFPDAAANPTLWGHVKETAAKVHGAIAGILTSASPRMLDIANAIFDTPADFQKFGFAPTMSGTESVGGDPIRSATGIGTHFALSLTSKVLSHAIVWAKGKLAHREDVETPEAVAEWLAGLLEAIAEVFGETVTVDREALLSAVKSLV